MLTRSRSAGWLSGLILATLLFAGSISFLSGCYDTTGFTSGSIACGKPWTAYAAWTDRSQRVFEASVERTGSSRSDEERPAAGVESLLDCPHPFAAPLVPVSPPSLAREQCRKIDSTNADFAVSICPLPASTCNSFSVIITRADGSFCSDLAARTNSSSISSSAEEAAFVKSSLGPDNFEITIDGAQRFVVSWPTLYSEASCEYRYDVRLSNAGAFTLAIAHLYSKYQGFSELWEDEIGTHEGRPWTSSGRVPAWPPLSDQSLISPTNISSQKLGLPISCPESCTSYRIDEKGQISPNPTGLRDRAPLCSRTDVVPHVYLPSSSSAGYAYQGVPLGCRLSTEDTNLLDLDTPTLERERCLGSRPRRIVLQGDSHARMMFDAMRPRLLGSADAPVYAKEKHKLFTAWQTEFEFNWDERAKNTQWDKVINGSQHPPSQADIFVLTTGAHQAYLHWSTSQFFDLMSDLAGFVHKRQKAKLPTIFISTPAYPPKRGQYVYDARDWRTNYRLANWSSESITRMRDLGVTVMDGFAATEPFDRLSPDSVHFRQTPAMEWMLKELMHKLALCQN